MPLYEYLCRECQKPAELLIRGEESPVCPECGGGQMVKLLSVPAAPAGAARTRGDGGPPPGPCGARCGCFPGG